MYGHGHGGGGGGGGGGASSDAISRDMNSLLYSSTFKHPADGEFAKIKQLISLDPYPNYDHHHLHNHNHNQNHDQNQQEDNRQASNHGSLLRYRSTPSSFFSNLLDDVNGDEEEFPDPVTDEPDAAAAAAEEEESYFTEQHQRKESESDARDFLRYESSSSERKESAIQNQKLPPPSTALHGGSRRATNLHNNGSYGGYTNQNDLDSGSCFRAMDSNSARSNLIRQSSSPDGFMSSLTVENGFGGMKDVRKGGSSSSSLNNHISFSLAPSSSSRFLPQIAENDSDLRDSTFGSLKRSRDGGLKMPQNIVEAGNRSPSLVHHMSLPKTSSEMAAVENILHFQQESSVPWKARAKRGFATHPRSIAERVRRTRISERIKRLQELFPNMDKQTNTADMLDMAVEYIKDLQKELQTLNEARSRCKCSSKQLHPHSTM